jgi:hypothetical protein
VRHTQQQAANNLVRACLPAILARLPQFGLVEQMTLGSRVLANTKVQLKTTS